MYLNRGRLIILAFYLPLALVLFFFANQILVGIGQDPLVSKLASGYIRMTLPGVFFQSQFDLTKRWLQAMRITLVPMLVQVIAIAMHAGMCY